MRIFLLLLLVGFSIACQEKSPDIIPIQSSGEEPLLKTEVVPATQEVDLSIIMGKFDPTTHPDFVEIEKQYADRAGLFLQREVYNSYKKMQAAAKDAGINLVIRSATRNFDYQRGIWERKWKANIESQQGISATNNALKILKYSSMPSTSRHHWGTDIDLNAFKNSWFENGEGLKLYNWLTQNASTYGFCQVYSAKGENRPHGYNEEKWHWSYMPIASKYYNIAKTHMEDALISGFDGAEVATEIGVVDKYILGINKNCN